MRQRRVVNIHIFPLVFVLFFLLFFSNNINLAFFVIEKTSVKAAVLIFIARGQEWRKNYIPFGRKHGSASKSNFIGFGFGVDTP